MGELSQGIRLMAAVLVVLCGIPGAGKTTLADALRGHRIGSDTLRAMVGTGEVGDYSDDSLVFELMTVIARNHLARGRSVVIDATNPTPALRHKWIRLASESKVPAVVVHVECSLARALQRNSERARSLAHAWVVDSAKAFEPPTSAEGFDGLFSVGADEDIEALIEWIRAFDQ